MKTSVFSSHLLKPIGVKSATTVVQIFGFAIFTALCAKVQFLLPFTPVPITLQTLSVILSGALLGSRNGAFSQLALIGMGLSGLPVFASSTPGYLSLVGPTAGYIFGFVLSAYLAGLFVERGLTKGWLRSGLFLFLSSLSTFIPGLLWLGFFTHKSFSDLLIIGFYPFLIGDFLKVILATSVITGIKK